MCFSSKIYQMLFETLEKCMFLRSIQIWFSQLNSDSLSKLWPIYIFSFSQHHFRVNTRLTDFFTLQMFTLSSSVVHFTSIWYHTLDWHVWFPQNYVCWLSCNNQLLEIWSDLLSLASNLMRGRYNTHINHWQPLKTVGSLSYNAKQWPPYKDATQTLLVI